MLLHVYTVYLALTYIMTTVMSERTLADDQLYCAIRYRRLCQGKGRHVACQFPTPEPGESCQNYTKIKFTGDLRHFIIHYINRRRQRVAAGHERVRGGEHLPRPEVMMLVEWDRELALLAQRLADQCHFVHDDCRATVRYPYAGQTVGEVRWRRSSESDELSAQRGIRRVFDAWWGERRRVEPKQLTTPFKLTAKGTVWGHFSQLAVWTLRAIGCGAVRHGSDYPRLLLVCDFSHTNMLGQRTLSPGPLTACPMHTARRPRSAYPLLCAPVRFHAPEKQSDALDDYDDEDESFWNDTIDDSYESSTYRDRDRLNRVSDRHAKSTKRTTTPTVVIKKITRRPIFRDKNIGGEKSSKGRMIDKLEQELETRYKVESPQFYEERVTQETRMIRPIFNRWRDNNENVDEQPLNPQQTMEAEEYRPTARTSLSSRYSLELQTRQRWKQTRDRPRRPGASALLHIRTPSEKARTSVAPFTLDKDDVDQLFRDTGFDWKNKAKQ